MCNSNHKKIIFLSPCRNGIPDLWKDFASSSWATRCMMPLGIVAERGGRGVRVVRRQGRLRGWVWRPGCGRGALYHNRVRETSPHPPPAAPGPPQSGFSHYTREFDACENYQIFSAALYAETKRSFRTYKDSRKGKTLFVLHLIYFYSLYKAFHTI